MNIIPYIKQPFPKSDYKWQTIISVSVIITLFLILIKPLGIKVSGDNYNEYFSIMEFGLITLIILFIDLILIERIFPNYFKENNWFIGKKILWLFIVISSIGVGNLLYSALYLNLLELTLGDFISFQLITMGVAIIPVSIFVFIKHQYLSKKNIDTSDTINEKLIRNNQEITIKSIITFHSYNNKSSVDFYVNDFFYIESKGNYVELYLLIENKIECIKLRNTIKKSTMLFSDYPNIIQCHRAYIINVNKIISTKGNSQGLKLKIRNCDAEIPVSRNFVNSVKYIL